MALQTLVSCTKKLELVLRDRDILVHLHQEGVIKECFFNDVDDPRSMLSAAQKSAKILSELKRLVRLDPKVYYLFLNYLTKQKRYAAVVADLNEQYRINQMGRQSGTTKKDTGDHRQQLEKSPQGRSALLYVIAPLLVLAAGIAIATVYYNHHDYPARMSPQSSQTPDSLPKSPQPLNTPAPQQPPQPLNTPAPQQPPQPLNTPAPQQPPQPLNTPAPQQPAGDKGCTEITSNQQLEDVLEQVDTPYERMCSHLGIAPPTCIGLKNSRTLSVFTIAQAYIDQHPVACWEDIIGHLCKDFSKNRLSSAVAKQYSIPWSPSLYCK